MAVKKKPQATITYKVNQQLSDIVSTSGMLDDSAAREDWDWRGPSFDLDGAVRKPLLA